VDAVNPGYRVRGLCQVLEYPRRPG